MPIAGNAMKSAAPRRRSRELSSDERSRAWARRDERTLQRTWLRTHWRVIVGLVVSVVLVCGLIENFAPSSVRGYVVGALIASAAWWLYCLMITASRFAGDEVGINAAAHTATELRRLCRGGWRLVNHVVLDQREVDHVLLGPSGFFAVETKFRSNWRDLDRDLSMFAASARETVDDVWLRLGLPRTRVEALVVLSGGGIEELRPPTFNVDGVTFCTELGLRAYLGTFVGGDVPEHEVASAHARLESNCARTARHEGPNPRHRR